MNTVIGENIKKLRTAKNMTQEDLAKRLAITKATVSSYENFLRLPSFDGLVRIARVFHVTTDYLLGFSSKYIADISALNQKQRNVVNDIIQLYNFQNAKIKEAVDSGSINTDAAKGFINDFDLEHYMKNNQ